MKTAIEQSVRKNGETQLLFLLVFFLPSFPLFVSLSLSHAALLGFSERGLKKKRGRREVKLFGPRNVYIPAVLYSIHSSSPNTCPSVGTTSGFRGRFRKTMQKYAIVGNRDLHRRSIGTLFFVIVRSRLASIDFPGKRAAEAVSARAERPAGP